MYAYSFRKIYFFLGCFGSSCLWFCVEQRILLTPLMPGARQHDWWQTDCRCANVSHEALSGFIALVAMPHCVVTRELIHFQTYRRKPRRVCCAKQNHGIFYSSMWSCLCLTVESWKLLTHCEVTAVLSVTEDWANGASEACDHLRALLFIVFTLQSPRTWPNRTPVILHIKVCGAFGSGSTCSNRNSYACLLLWLYSICALWFTMSAHPVSGDRKCWKLLVRCFDSVFDEKRVNYHRAELNSRSWESNLIWTK